WFSTVVGRLRVPKWAAPPLGDTTPAPPIPFPAAASLRSSPLQNPRPAPVMTITRTSPSVSASESFSVNSSNISKLIAFNRSGRLSVIVATLSFFSYSKSGIGVLLRLEHHERAATATSELIAQRRDSKRGRWARKLVSGARVPTNGALERRMRPAVEL